MKLLIHFCRWIVIANLSLISCFSFAENGFNILQTLDLTEESQGQFYDRVATYYFDKDNNILYVIGYKFSDTPIQTLYVWDYDPNSHQLAFKQKATLEFPNSQYVNFEIVAKVENKLIISNYDNLDIGRYLTSIDLNDGFKFVKVADLIPPETGGDFISVKSSDNTILNFIITASNSLVVKKCTFNNSSSNCEDVISDPIQLSNSTSYPKYNINVLDGFNQFIINSFESDTKITKGNIFQYDEFGNLTLLNTISPPNNVQIKQVISLKSKSELFIYSSNTNLYPHKIYTYNNDTWLESNKVVGRGLTGLNLHIQFVNGSNYGLDEECTTLIYSEENVSFHSTGQSKNLAGGNANCILIEGEYGLSLGLTNKKIESFQLANTLPITQINSLNSNNHQWTQDKYSEINLNDYYTNANQLTIQGLPSPLKFDGHKITGTPSKKDLFVATNNGNYEPIDGTRVYVFAGTKELTSFMINYININDAPELISPLSKEYLKEGGSYEAQVQEMVWDPDYDSPLSITFTNIPPNTIADEYGQLKINPAQAGIYNIGVTVKDAHGGELKFTIEIEVNKSGTQEEPSTSNGGGSLGINLLFLFTLLVFRRFNALVSK